MTTNLITRSGNKLTLNGTELTGDTFAAKDYIKSNLAGKWNPANKSWTVDAAKTLKLANTPGAQIRIDNTPAAQAETHTTRNGWCNKCHSYCYGDCEA